jgi:histidine decarboxylase
MLRNADRKRLDDFKAYFDDRIAHMIGYQMAVDFDYRELYPFFDHHLNNVGDPYVEPAHVSAKEFEREVIEFYADLFRAPKDDRWGYVTNGGTEGNLYALYLARGIHPDARVYYSEAAHYSIEKALHLLRMTGVKVAAQASGEMDYTELAKALAARKGQTAIVVATIGTTMTEAKDNVATIIQTLKQQKVQQYYIHSDAAFAGILTALLEPDRPFDLADGANSVSISGHKFIGSPIPCGIFITKLSNREHAARTIEYNGALDTTINGSRSGHTPLIIWYAMKRWGREGFAKRARACIKLADYTEQALRDNGWEVRRNPKALTILFPKPAENICKKWQLSTHNGWSHLVCAPGLSRERIDEFMADLGKA